MGKNIGKTVSKNLSGKHDLDQAKRSTSKKVIHKIAKATGDLIGNKNADTYNCENLKKFTTE